MPFKRRSTKPYYPVVRLMPLSLRSPETTSRAPLMEPPLKAVIFDRDGVLIRDVGFPHRLDQLQWTDGALDLLRELRSRKVTVLVASNQSGVARGLFSTADVDNFNEHLSAQARAAGGQIDHFEYCPHLPTGTQAPFNTDCLCRKPKPGMLHALIKRFSLDTNETVLIGDRDSDMLAASAVGVRGWLFTGGDLNRFFWGRCR